MILTPRQQEMARLVADGLSNAEIAARTQLSLATVKEYVSAAARRVPGATPPRHRLTRYVLQLESGQ